MLINHWIKMKILRDGLKMLVNIFNQILTSMLFTFYSTFFRVSEDLLIHC